MSFPTHWVQLWVDLPRPNPGLEYPYKTSLQWFFYKFPINFSTYDFHAAGQALLAWAISGPLGLASSGPFATTGRTASVYWYQGGLQTGLGVSIAGNWPTQPILPYALSVVIRRQTGLYGPSNNGHFFVSPVPQALTKGDALSTLGYTQFHNRCVSLPLTIVSGGTTYVPSLASYKNSTFQPIIGWTPVQKLGLLKRRQRERLRLGPGPLSGPKLPPP